MDIRKRNRNFLRQAILHDRRLFVSVVVVSLLAAIFEGFGLGLIVPFLQGLTNANAAPMATGIEWIDIHILAVNAETVTRLYRLSALILVSVWLKSWLSLGAAVLSVNAKEAIVNRLRLDVYDQLQRVSLGYFANTRTGDIINSLTNEMQRLRQLLSVVFELIVKGFLTFAYVIAVLVISWQLTVLVVLFFSILSGALTWIMSWIRRSGKRIANANARLTSTSTEIVTGIRTIAAFGTQSFERERFGDASGYVQKVTYETGRRKSYVQPVLQAATVTVLIVLIVYATQAFVLTGRLEPALLLGFLFALFRLMPLVKQMNQARASWHVFYSALDNVSNLLDTSDKPIMKDGTLETDVLRDKLVFEHVYFAYDGTEHVLKDVSIQFRAGQTTAIVGASGSGKSTLVNLVPRFHDPTKGRLLYDGTDLREMRLASLRRHIAVVSQDTFLFNNTVSANIGYGLTDVTEESIREAAEGANVLEFIETLPKGFDTMIGERGVKFSGGQRQRIAIARALLRNPDILILDEATSALDSISEKLVQSALTRLMEGRTVLVVAHRLSTIENADWVIVLEAGRVVEQGTFEDLLAREGKFWEYHSIQYQLA